MPAAKKHTIVGTLSSTASVLLLVLLGANYPACGDGSGPCLTLLSNFVAAKEAIIQQHLSFVDPNVFMALNVYETSADLDEQGCESLFTPAPSTEDRPPPCQLFGRTLDDPRSRVCTTVHSLLFGHLGGAPVESRQTRVDAGNTLCRISSLVEMYAKRIAVVSTLRMLSHLNHIKRKGDSRVLNVMA